MLTPRGAFAHQGECSLSILVNLSTPHLQPGGLFISKIPYANFTCSREQEISTYKQRYIIFEKSRRHDIHHPSTSRNSLNPLSSSLYIIYTNTTTVRNARQPHGRPSRSPATTTSSSLLLVNPHSWSALSVATNGNETFETNETVTKLRHVVFDNNETVALTMSGDDGEMADGAFGHGFKAKPLHLRSRFDFYAHILGLRCKVACSRRAARWHIRQQ